MERENRLEPDRSTASESPRLISDPMPRCPRCGWQDVRRSRLRFPLDNMLGMISLCPFRCRSCGRRFYRLFRVRREE